MKYINSKENKSQSQDTDEAENVEDDRPPGHDEELLEAPPPLMQTT